MGKKLNSYLNFYFILSDFDECSDNKYHDCSDHAQCFNLRGTYTCSCKEGFTDMSYNTQLPGRVCSGRGTIKRNKFCVILVFIGIAINCDNFIVGVSLMYS